MKKLFALILIAGLLLTGTMVSAEETASSDTPTKARVFKDLKVEFKSQMVTIKANRAEIIRLRQEATTLQKETKTKVKELLKSKDDISQVQIEAIKQSVDLLVADKKLLVGTKGDIFKESVDLRLARRNRDSEAYKAALEDIISIQKSRIDTLNKVIADLKTVGVI